jgi:catechol 2,3-dioxygenase-like lactoylglutathione lyase family enzyme
MTGPVLNQLNLVVRDMAATLKFYRLLGLDIPDDAVWRTESGAHHVNAKMPGGLQLEFDSAAMVKTWNAGWQSPAARGSQCVIGFKVDTRDAVDTCYAKMTGAGYAGRQLPFDGFWGARYAVIEDPDGNHVGVMSPIDPARKGPPPKI